MRTNRQWLERTTLIAEYRACVEHYTALITVNLATAHRQKPTGLIETARLNCEAVKAKLAEHKNADPPITCHLVGTRYTLPSHSISISLTAGDDSPPLTR